MEEPLLALHAGTARSAGQARTAHRRYLGRCKLAPNSVKAYQRQCDAYLAWLDQHTAAKPPSFLAA